ncbi:Eco57I restriction-modification methylase domain-containing protein [Sulfurimonas sp.]|uniref:Eco57I restriction-modification methylase domain-containing protein n=1 Tax=Sulfurimonas sp. TaxID=2022749 RepID=UPI002AB04B70|nr:N-6 DNA methylase [Sulfurimonas sp.]
MAIFQKSVLLSALEVNQDESLVALRWAEYQKYLSKIDFIKTVKEEKYQDGFLKDVFENCLGYRLDSTNPDNFNLEREKKNETDAKKADAVIYVNNEVIGIIELKAQDTKNLDKIESQAFNYHNSHSNSKYIIISNFDELRLYIDKKTAYEKFSLFNLNYKEFKKLHLLLSYESIKDNIPQKLKDKSASFEQDISKSLYKDFSAFRTHLFENLVKNNSLDKALLLRLTQKLCDRIIFILFAEDRGLLTANTIKEIRQRHQSDGFGDRSMYDYFKLYFDAINKGNERLNIPKYNGGLFAVDETLDSLIIDDNILDLEAQALSNYDFMSDISVNILGHIFEQSLTDLEEINASINDVEFDSKKSKRKKDGVFYTPEYITKYIVDNTLGKLCNDKREELSIGSETLVSPKNPKKPTKKEQILKDNLEEYRGWLLNLKILDPACGSGAFLNQALDFLISEHNSLQRDLVVMGDITAYYEIEKSILENNLYGVDINEDAIEIAKLSLWLRTASKGRELTKLADKIKCGNSLIDDKSVVDNAFVWEEEFSEVFEQHKIMLDTNIIIHGYDTNDKTQSKEILKLLDNGNLKFCISSRTIPEIPDNKYNNEKLRYLDILDVKGSLFRWDVSSWDANDIFASEKDIDYSNKIYNIITRKNPINDTDILQSAMKNNIKFFITNNTKDFIKKDDTRQRLEQLTGVKILTPKEFMEYYKKDYFSVGFDIIIGNPPYGAKLSKSDKDYFNENFKTVEYQLDTYTLFMEKAYKLLHSNGKLGYIVPSTWLTMFYFKNLRKYLIENSCFENVLLFRYQVFEDVTAETSIITLSKNKILNENILINYFDNTDELETKQNKTISQNDWLNSYELGFNLLFGGNKLKIINKIIEDTVELENIANVTVGIKPYQTNKGTPKQTKDNVKNRIYDADYKIDQTYKNYIVGGSISKFSINPSSTNWLKYGKFLAEPRQSLNFFQTKIMVRQTSDRIISAVDYQGLLSLNNVHNIVIKNDILKYETLTCILNSKLMDFYYKFLVPEEGRVFAEVKAVNLKRLPIKNIDKDFKQEPFIQKADLMLQLNKNLQEAKQNFINELELEKIPKKLQNFEDLTFDDFVKEYKKAKKLKFADKLEERNFKNDWKALFENDAKIALDLKSQINATDKDIDVMVYKLYGLSDDEIKIVEKI